MPRPARRGRARAAPFFAACFAPSALPSNVRGMPLLWVCLGGAAGSGARYLLSTWMLARFGPAFPWGTIAVNVIGSFFLGVVVTSASSAASPISPALRVALATGVLGGFTTYSTFNQDTLRLASEGRLGLAVANVALTVVVCLLSGLAGIAVVR